MSDMHKDCTAITPAMLTEASKNESWLSCFQANTSATVNLSAAIMGSVGELATATLSAVHLFDPVIPRIRLSPCIRVSMPERISPVSRSNMGQFLTTRLLACAPR